MPDYLFDAPAYAFLAALCALCLLSLRAPAPSGTRNYESVLLLVVSGLAVGGLALAHTGINYSWTGRAAITDWHWLELAALFVASLAVAHALLRFGKSRMSQIMLPVASVLALLGLITVYTWEVRDANSYISTEGLPAMRHYLAVAENSATRSQDAADMRELSASMPDETAYELAPDNIAHHRFATALNSQWVGGYNDAVKRFRAHAIDGSEQPDVHSVTLYRVTHRQLEALLLAICLVPFWSWLCERHRLAATLGSTRFLVGSGVFLLVLALPGIVLSRGAVPSLSLLTSDSVNTFEVMKIALVMFIASALAFLRSQARPPSWPVLAFLGLSLVLPLIAFASRDLGTALVLGLVSGSLLIVGTRGFVRRMLIAVSVAAVLVSPVAMYLSATSISSTARARVETWIDPEEAIRQSSETNLVNASLERMIRHRLDGKTDLGSLPTVVRNDVASVLRELDWRLQARQSGRRSEFQPFVPASDPAEELLLVDAETIWQAIGGYDRVPSEDAMTTLAQRLSRVHERFDSAVAEFGVKTAAITRAESPAVTGNIALAGPPRNDLDINSAILSSIARVPDGFQLARASRALTVGGMFGVGLGRGRPEAIPGVTEDAAFASLGEALGFTGSLAVVLLLLVLVYRGIATIVANRLFALNLLAAGLSMLLAAQALVDLTGLLGLLPYTGIGFPFISRGGSAAIVNFFVVGVLAALPSQQPAQRPSAAAFVQSRRHLMRGMGDAAIAACFGFVLLPLGWLQVGGRSLIPGALLRSPAAETNTPDNLDQWSGPLFFRALPGPILDRHGTVLAETHLDGLGWRSDDQEIAVGIGHVVEALDEIVRQKATEMDERRT